MPKTEIYQHKFSKKIIECWPWATKYFVVLDRQYRLGEYPGLGTSKFIKLEDLKTKYIRIGKV